MKCCRSLFAFQFKVIIAFSTLALEAIDVLAQVPSPASTLNDATKKLDSAAKARQQDTTLESRIRESTWRLLQGEVASGKSLGLSSGAFDALTRGLVELDQLLTELEQQPELERKLSTQPQLAMRFDSAVARRADAVAKKDLNRADELARLSQLRELNRTYRTLIRHLLSIQTEQLLGQVDETTSNGEEAAKQLTLAEQVVGKRRDFYLFEDEPALEGNNSELKLIQEIAAPYSVDVRRHQRALLAVTLCRLALQSELPSKEILEAALTQADAALADAESPSAVALYARGLASLEIGRLLTRNEPFKDESHKAAADWFQKSQESLVSAQKLMPEKVKLSALRTDLDQLIAEGTSPDVYLSRALELEQRGDLKGAASALVRGVTRHRSRELAMAWIETQWRAGTLDDTGLSKLLSELVQSAVVKPDDAEYLTLRGRIGVINVWRAMNAADDAKPVEAQQAALSQRLLAGLADLKAIPVNIAESMRWSNEAYIALAESTALLLDQSRDKTQATNSLQKVPLIVAELERLMAGKVLHEQLRYWEAIQLARVAEGYLSLRLVPDYQDRARLAFAAAADAGAKLSNGSMALSPAGGAMLRALLQRDESASNRLAQEERQLRVSLQKMLPALVAIPVSDPNTVADSLVMAHRAARATSPTWDPRKQLDARDTIGARDGLVADSRAITAMALVSAKKSDAALQELLTDLWPSIDASDLQSVDWNAVWDKSAELADPLNLYALALAMEEYSVSVLPKDVPERATLLKHALAMFERAVAILNETSAWRERWPYLSALSEAGRDRLANEETALRHAKSLRADLRLSEARNVLEQARHRHPRSIKLREELVQALIDEAQLSPDKQEALLAQALAQLEADTQNESNIPTSILLTLAELRERLGKEAEASQAYREIAARSENQSERLKARSRLVVLQVRNRQ